MMLTKALAPQRAQVYRLLSRVYRVEADGALLDALTARREAWNDPEWAKAVDALAGPREEVLEALAVDYAGLFLAAGRADGAAAIPNESLYGPEQRFMGDAWEDMEGRLKAEGLTLGEDARDLMADHLAMELEFMAHLVEHRDFKAQRAFLEAHLLNWVPRWAEDVAREARGDFYPAMARVTAAFLKKEGTMLGEDPVEAPSFSVRAERFDAILARLRERYRVCAPVRFPGRGPKGGDLIRYGEIRHLTDLVHSEKSHLSAKEVFYPVSQTMFRFTDRECTQEELSDGRDILLFLRPCDLNAVERLDNIFLRNGQPDLYYQRLREKVKFVLLECAEGFENCFCVSMGTNRAYGYHAAVRIDDICALFEICDEALLEYFKDEVPARFTPRFVSENQRRAELPVIRDRAELKAVIESPYWDKYNDACIGCGGCSTGCPTCSCFDTVDVIYNETSRDGERRRVWSSCMLSDFTRTAGGAVARKTPGANTRFKVLHKVYDYKLRFGVPMCVGCGRCIDRCPKDIDYLDTVNGLTAWLRERKEGEENG